jgi:ribosome-associated protein
MIILEDTRQQDSKHNKKREWFEANGIEVKRTKLYVGDYTFPKNQSVCVDTKKDIQELIGDICGKQHDRFREELIRAKEADIKLYILVENERIIINERKGIYSPYIDSLDSLHKFVNPRLFIWRNGKQLYPTATKGITLKKACITMKNKYGVEFIFCKPNQAAEKVIELLATNETLDVNKKEKEFYGRVVSSGSE